MKVLVIGANGQIGSHLVKKLSDSNQHTPIAMVREDSQKESFESEGVESVKADLEDSIETLAGVFEGVDAVVFAAGSGGHTGADKTMLIDLDGAIKSMEAAKKKDVKRYIMVSALGAHKWHKDPDALKSKGYYRAAKFYADDWLEKSGLGLDYTIVRPGRLLNEAGTGQVTISENLEHDTIPREDVASVIVSALDNTNTIGKSFDVLSGSTEIDEAVKQV